jgi:hypothetical protein
MTMIDRRSGRDRRDNERYAVNVEIEWESAAGRKSGTLSDIGLNGCFVLSSGEVQDGETVKLFFPLSSGMKAQFLAEVANNVFEIGFAVRFIQLSETQWQYIEDLVESVKNRAKR